MKMTVNEYYEDNATGATYVYRSPSGSWYTERIVDKNQWMKIVAVVFEEADVDDTLSKGLSKWIQNWSQSVAGRSGAKE